MKIKIAAAITAALLIAQSLASCQNASGGDSADTTAADTSAADTTETDTTAAEATDDISTADIGKAIEEEFGDDFSADADIDADMLESIYGIAPEWVVDFYAKQAMISFNVDLFIAVRAAEGHGDDVEAALNDYADYNYNDAFQYPSNLPKIKAGRVYRSGDYVFYIVLGVMDGDKDDDANYETAVEYDQRAVDVIDRLLGGE